MLIDHHMHFVSEKKVSELIEKFDIKKVILFPKLIETDKKDPYLLENKKVLNFSLENKKIIPYMMIHPILDSIDTIKKNANLFYGFKLNCNAKRGGYDYGILATSKIFEYILSLKKPIIFHTGFKEGHRIRDLLTALKKSKSPVIFAHAGRFIEKDLKLASKYKNAYIDICPLNTISENPRFIAKESKIKEKIINKDFNDVINFLLKYFSKRIVWGSDYPSCEKLSNKGYLGELNISNLLKEKGEINTFLSKDILNKC